jgi:hypothetical protein
MVTSERHKSRRRNEDKAHIQFDIPHPGHHHINIYSAVPTLFVATRN